MIRFLKYGLKVIIDGKSLVYLDGTNLISLKKALNEGVSILKPLILTANVAGRKFNV